MENGDLYETRDPRNYIEDGEPRALYWYAYRGTYNVLKDYLACGREVSSTVELDDYLPPDSFLSEFFNPSEDCPCTYSIPILLVRNSLLQPFSFDPRGKDRVELCDVKSPGISATIGFSKNKGEVCGALFDRDCRRQDHLYLTTIDRIIECNYSVIYLPTPNQPLHVRIVHNDHLKDPSIHLPPFNDRERICRLFQEGRIV